MDKLAQTQKGGDNAVQNQIGTQIVVGIDEKRVREICDEKIEYAIKDLSAGAIEVAKERINAFTDSVLTKIKENSANLSSFADPSFQRDIIRAQMSAAESDREADVDTLAELLMARMNGKLKRATKTGIRKAMEIVPELEADELMVLTILLFYTKYKPNNARGMSVQHYLNALDSYFKNILQSDLPIGDKWLQHLTILDAVIVEHLSSFVPLDEYYGKSANGLVCAGLRVGSQEHTNSVEILNQCGMGADCLVPNDLLPGFVRLPLVKSDDFSFLPINIPNIPKLYTMSPNAKHIEGLKKVIGLYSKDSQLLKQVKDEFAKRISQYGVLKRLKDWLANRKGWFELTSVGEALGYVNARRCIPGLPAIELE